MINTGTGTGTENEIPDAPPPSVCAGMAYLSIAQARTAIQEEGIQDDDARWSARLALAEAHVWALLSLRPSNVDADADGFQGGGSIRQAEAEAAGFDVDIMP